MKAALVDDRVMRFLAWQLATALSERDGAPRPPPPSPAERLLMESAGYPLYWPFPPGVSRGTYDFQCERDDCDGRCAEGRP